MSSLHTLTIHGLKYGDASPFTAKVLIRLAFCPLLKELHLKMNAVQPGYNLVLRQDLHHGAFAALQWLTFVGAADAVISVSRYLPVLQFLDIGLLWHDGVAEEVVNAFMAQLTLPRTLEFLFLSHALDDMPVALVPLKLMIRSEDLLRIGRVCPLLRHASFMSRRDDVCYSISDQDIRAFAKSVPQLRAFVLGESGDCSMHIVFTSQALNALGTYCPNIEQISIPVDFCDALKREGTDSPLFPCLRYLDIYALRGFTEPVRIKTLLSYHFPALEALYCPYRIGPLRPPFTVDRIREWLARV